MDFSEEAGGEATGADTVSAPKRGRGRVKGSKNKVGRQGREILAKEGHAAWNTIIRWSKGLSTTRTLKGGLKETIYPDVAEIRWACEMVAKRTVPELRAIEAVVDQTVRADQPKESPRQVARAIISVLQSAVPEGHVALTEAGEYTARFHDGDLGRKIMGNGDAAAAELVRAADAEAVEPALTPPDEMQPGDGVDLPNGFYASVLEVLRDGRRRFVVFDPRGAEIGRHVGFADCETQVGRLLGEGRYAGFVRDADDTSEESA